MSSAWHVLAYFSNKLRSRLFVRHIFPLARGEKHIFCVTRVPTKLATAISFDLPKTSGTISFFPFFLRIQYYFTSTRMYRMQLITTLSNESFWCPKYLIILSSQTSPLSDSSHIFYSGIFWFMSRSYTIYSDSFILSACRISSCLLDFYFWIQRTLQMSGNEVESFYICCY
jgi:hypothetical protein